MDYAQGSKAAVAYLAFADEILAGDHYVPQVELATLKDLRKSHDMNSAVVEELAEDIRKQGMKTPIEVRELKNGTYEVVHHFDRFHAASLADHRMVPILIKNDFASAE